MTFVASTLSEHLRQEGEVRGKKIGKEIGEARGKKIGRLEGALDNLQELFDQGLIAKEVYEIRAAKLRQDLEAAIQQAVL